MKKIICNVVNSLGVVIRWFLLVFVALCVVAWWWKELLLAYIVVWLLSLLIVGLFFAARWSMRKEWDKDSQPSRLRGAIIFSAVWLFNGLVMLFGLFDRNRRRLFFSGWR